MSLQAVVSFSPACSFSSPLSLAFSSALLCAFVCGLLLGSRALVCHCVFVGFSFFCVVSFRVLVWWPLHHNETKTKRSLFEEWGGAHVSKPKCEPRLQSSLVVALALFRTMATAKLLRLSQAECSRHLVPERRVGSRGTQTQTKTNGHQAQVSNFWLWPRVLDLDLIALLQTCQQQQLDEFTVVKQLTQKLGNWKQHRAPPTRMPPITAIKPSERGLPSYQKVEGWLLKAGKNQSQPCCS